MGFWVAVDGFSLFESYEFVSADRSYRLEFGRFDANNTLFTVKNGKNRSRLSTTLRCRNN